MQHHKKRIFFILFLVITLMGIALVFRGFERAKPSKSGHKIMGPPPVTVAQASLMVIPQQISALGTVQSIADITLRAQAEGQVRAVHIHEGQFVKKGDPLFTIDPRPLQTTLAQSQAVVAEDLARIQQAQANVNRDMAQINAMRANVTKDQAQLRLATTQEKRYAQLLRAEYISRQEYDQTVANKASAQATVQADQAAVQNAEAVVKADEAAVRQARATMASNQAAVENANLHLSYTFIRSPITGKTGMLNVHMGDTVKINDTALLTIARLDPVDILFTIPESQIGLVRQFHSNSYYGSSSSPAVKVPPRRGKSPAVDRSGVRMGFTNGVGGDLYSGEMQVLAEASPGGPNTLPDAASQNISSPASSSTANPGSGRIFLAGKLVFIDNAADPNTGTIRLKARFDNPELKLWPGQYIPVRIILSQGAKTVVVPTRAVQTGQQGDYVLVVDQRRKAWYRVITTGRTYHGMTAVLNGLSSGETVITDGQLLVAPGMPVAVKKGI